MIGGRSACFPLVEPLSGARERVHEKARTLEVSMLFHGANAGRAEKHVHEAERAHRLIPIVDV
jgi:hypothetical protein